jgi:hypothetical protein
MTSKQGAVKDLESLQKLIGDRIATLQEKAEALRDNPQVGEQERNDIKTVSGMITGYTQALKLIEEYDQTDRLNRAIESVLSTAKHEQKPTYIRFTCRDTPWIVQIEAITRVRISKPEKPDQELVLEIKVTGENNTLHIRGKEAEAALKVFPCVDLATLAQEGQMK